MGIYEPIQLVPVSQRTPRQWVEYYLQIESDVLSGKDVTMENGRRVVMEDLGQIIKARQEWERRATIAAQQSNVGRSSTFGSFSYRAPDLT